MDNADKIIPILLAVVGTGALALFLIGFAIKKAIKKIGEWYLNR